MSYEIEVKAWVKEPQAVRGSLDQEASFLRHFEKNDVYFEGEATYADQPVTVRIREDDGKSLCTFKERRTVDGVEHNREWEFAVGNAEAMETLLLRLGLPELVRKRKLGASYRYDDLLVELSEVEGLGHFIEVEKLVDTSADEATQAEAKAQVRRVISHFGIPDDAVEGRPYTELLLRQR